MNACLRSRPGLAAGLLLLLAWPLAAAPVSPAAVAAESALSNYFRAETRKLEEACLAEIRSRADWEARRGEYRAQLFDMLGLQPLPARGDLQAVVTRRDERETCVVENVQFQSLPGLYVTANLYLPKNPPGPVPAVLYLCGHSAVISNGVSYGNKVDYQHHGVWFARHGYACLVVDSLQLGEILGLHHGTYREGLWWWNARGYTPAGVEAWNCIRALDYLETRKEIDSARIGATGRSGGGAYSWWIAALDDRIRAAAPVAGITDLHNHVVDGTVAGHCDCMFTVNTHRWDYPQIAALVSPRPLLIVNTDADSIFPLDGVVRLHARVRRIYELQGAAAKLGLVIGPGGHKDTQDLQIPVLRWFNQHLLGRDPLITLPAEKAFTPEELKVFSTLPAGRRNTNIHETFVPMASSPALPASRAEVAVASRLAALSNECFRGWPADAGKPKAKPVFRSDRHGLRLEAWDFTSQDHVPLRLYAVQHAMRWAPGRVKLTVLDTPGFARWLGALRVDFAADLGEELRLPLASAADPEAMAALREEAHQRDHALAWVAPRGAGLGAWEVSPREFVQIRRRFMLLGQTLDGMRVWDVRRTVQALQEIRPGAEVELAGEGDMACHALYAALFESGVKRLELRRLPVSHRSGPDYLNVLKVLDVPEAVALAVTRVPVWLEDGAAPDWAYPRAVAALWGEPGRLGYETIPGPRGQ